MNRNGAAIAQEIASRLAVDAASAYLGLSTSTLNKMRCEGRGPRYLRLGARVFYRKEDLDHFVLSSIVETTDSRAAA